MSKQAADDLAAVRTVIDALQPFSAEDQERILRWAREKLGLIATPQARSATATPVSLPSGAVGAASSELPTRTDLKGFVAAKAPKGDAQFAATVAYFYRFEAPEGQRRASINSHDLLDACRLAGRPRLKKPIATLHNAHRDGLLDRGSEKGSFVINSVGENLVALALPAGGAEATGRRVRRKANRSKPRKKK